MHFKHPVRAAFFALCLFLSVCVLLSSAPRVKAAGDICFVAIDDTFAFDLSSATMPFWEDGVLYVPYNTFENSALSIYINFDKPNWILSLSNSNHQLDFYISQICSYDGEGNYYSDKAITKNSVVFLPFKFTCLFFGLDPQYITSDTAYPIARIATGAQVYSKKNFAIQAASIMASRAAAYLGSGSPRPSGSTPPSAPVSSSSPSPGTSHGSSVVALWIDTDGQALPEMLTALENYGFGATFFFEASSVQYHLPEIQDLWSRGFSPALTATEGSVHTSLRSANDILDEDLHLRLRLCSLPKGSATTTMKSYGYIPYAWDLDGDLFLTGGLSPALSAYDEEKPCILRVTLTEQNLEGILGLLETLAQEDLSVLPVRETS